MIIKGNNLLALHSLKSQFAGKIKLIYIDPPFNTGKDSFNYNDQFNRSTWLTFMRNRLMIAKSLLREDGNIFVHLDFNESHYAKVLMDEIFGEANFKNNIVWCYTGPSGSNNFLPRKHDDILYYSNSTYSKINLPYIAHKSGVHNTGQVFGSKESKESFKDNAETKGKKLEDWWVDIYSTDRYRSEAIGFSGQKPEKLIQRIIEMTTESGDIILDYHLGSGTTASVAHKMNRQYIAIEQIDHQIELSKIRLNNVTNGDQTGISKSVNWQGGGEFIYFELAKHNETAKEKILNCQDLKELEDLFDELYENYFLNYNLKIKEFKEKVLNEDEFKILELEEQKRMFLTMLDLNQMYVNKSEMADKNFAISPQDQELTKEFYKSEV